MFCQLLFQWHFPAKALRKKINGAVKVCEADPLHLVRHDTHEVKNSCKLMTIGYGIVKISQPWPTIGANSEQTKLLTREVRIRIHGVAFDLIQFCHIWTIFIHANATEHIKHKAWSCYMLLAVAGNASMVVTTSITSTHGRLGTMGKKKLMLNKRLRWPRTPRIQNQEFLPSFIDPSDV